MVMRKDIRQIRPYVYEVARNFRHDMRVPARFYADELILQQALNDDCLDQLINTATLPGIVGYALAMPDIHQGYGFPIGGVVATAGADGVISPGGVGFDINCGVRLLASHLDRQSVQPYLSALATELYKQVPSGAGEKGFVSLSVKELDEVLAQGSRWALKKGFARADDLENTEERGMMAGADPAHCSTRAKERGKSQLGTLGSGNHFAEVDEVAEIYDDEAAQAMGLFPGQIVVMIHCGSRGFGHQVCTDYVDMFQKVIHKYGIHLPDRQLVCAPLQSPEGQAYYAAMSCAANFAFANRQLLAHQVRQAFRTVLAGKVKNFDLFQVYDITHNMAKIEMHDVDGQRLQVCVHRKGATRAFGPGADVLPRDYQDIGQPVLVPGSMGTASYVLVGTAGSMAQTFGSSCHGAGRVMSRSAAKRLVQGGELRGHLQAQGIEVRAGSLAGLAEEAPSAYKDVDHVVDVVHNAGIARRVARLVPVAVVKG
ncbi:RtcB family protein [Candidatus Amarolinea dominans]|uniref:RtcB family protein n=1 Tax=Candidatus Amarolinea dominans TaxID=3140696 RepID=UPI00313553CE|nr:RtcB family protein [Anaerolineae bacterium]